MRTKLHISTDRAMNFQLDDEFRQRNRLERALTPQADIFITQGGLAPT